MSTTTAPAARGALIAQLQAASGLSGVMVWDDRPGSDHDLHENVYVTDIDQQSIWISLGPRLRREETYAIDVEIEVFREGPDAAGVNARVWQIQAAVEAAVMADVTLAGTVQFALPSTTKKTSQVTQGGHLKKIVMAVEVTARISN